jgi:hypothetical protein
MDKRRSFIFISYIFLILIIVISTLIWHAHHIEKQMREIKAISETAPEEMKRRGIAPALIPSRPGDYGMVVTGEFDKPRSQAEWNELLHNKLTEVKSQISPQELNKIRDKINEEPEKTQEKLAKIDKSIQECSEILQKEPENKDIQAKLERLMILKGLAEGFHDF